ncbi:MAG: J domain-containing protein [Bosea sp. (in: a-proteobacteria)]
MKFNSRLFDKIRISSDEPATKAAPEQRLCDHKGCLRAGEFRAPKGRDREGEFFLFCFEHVKEYNARYNYFNGMSDDAVASYQKEAIIGHRPTWKLGVNGQAARTGGKRTADAAERIADPFNLFGSQARAEQKQREAERAIGNAERAALSKLDLEPAAEKALVKSRYKELVKRLHPDANGGDRSREERLQEIIKAYNYLKSVGRA